MSDHRKVDDGTAGPRSHGSLQGEVIEGEELHNRAKFLRDRHVHAKVVKAPEHKKPKHSTDAQTK
jgi:hypothetical protein